MHAAHKKNRSCYRAFTLIELIVSISILVILVTITAASMNWSANKDRVPNGANEVASFIMGARDRAIFRRAPTGVRLILNQDGPVNAAGNPITVSSMMYIGSPEEITGTLSIEFLADSTNQNHRKRLRFIAPGGDNRPGDMGDYTNEFQPGVGGDFFLRKEFRDFERLSQLGLLGTGVQISLRPGGSRWKNFTLLRVPRNPPPPPGPDDRPGPDGYDWLLSADYSDSNSVGDYMNLEFKVKPLPAILPNQEPRNLPRGVVIDLESSRRQCVLPRGWYAYVGGTSPMQPDHYQYSGHMDIIFSPRGTGYGESGASGLIHLVIAEAADVERTEYIDSVDSGCTVGGQTIPPSIVNQPFYALGLNPEERPNAGQERVVTINPSSGKISVSHLDLTDVIPSPTSTSQLGGCNICSQCGNTIDPSFPPGIPDDPFRYAERGKTAP